MQLNGSPQLIRQQIENLKLAHPELMEDDESWQMSLESETDINALLSFIIGKIEDARALVIGTENRFEELEKRKQRFETRIEVLRGLAFKIMQTAEITKLELPLATLSIRKGSPQLVGDADPAALPDALCKTSRSIDSTAIKDALKGGTVVPGFNLSNSPPSISIRIK